MLRSLIWVVLSLAFNVLVWKSKGGEDGLDFLTGYVIEYSLSVDNIFVFVLIFTYFRVPPRSQHRVLVWGILGALVMRGVMIWLGVALVERFHFVLYIFGAFLVLTGLRMLFDRDAKLDFEKNFFMRLCRKMLPLTQEFHGRRFAVRIDGRLMFTPLLLVLILVDVMDLIFAVDSIPAVFAITTDQFIVYTSNICAILGIALALFPPRAHGRSLHLSQDRPRHHSRFRRHKDDPGQAVPYSNLALPHRDHRHSGNHHHRLDGGDQAAAATPNDSDQI